VAPDEQERRRRSKRTRTRIESIRNRGCRPSFCSQCFKSVMLPV
jgi:hypothetical protein